ncbi:MAG: asparagine synthase (glutamine-hydrolyzing) [Verrucomicrobiota bacterium]
MCGICGIMPSSPRSLVAIQAMNDRLAHRGPDGEGIYLGGEQPWLSVSGEALPGQPATCALGHRRLAVLDPAGGAQPITSEDRQVAVVLNGEIYNFETLRERFTGRGISFQTDTDTEILLHLYLDQPDHPEAWLKELRGIFAFAIWDNRRGRLLLARDHFGVKPLHVAQSDGSLFFASEIKSLLAAGVKPRLNDAALHALLNVRFIPGQQTLFKDIWRLPPAHFAWVEEGRMRDPVAYYQLPVGTDSLSEDEQIRGSDTAFYQAVESQLLSDVPIGIGLSGGLDSGMIVAAAANRMKDPARLRVNDRAVRTFTLGFNQPDDENDDAAIVARRFDTEHHDLRLPLGTLDEMKEILWYAEEPKLNVLQVFKLAQFARQEVKVFFSGLGGDELFAGYDIHRFANTLGRLHGATPGPVQRGLLRPLSQLLWGLQQRNPMRSWDHYRIGGQIALSLGDRTQFYTRLRNTWDYDAGMYARIYADPERFRAVPRTHAWFEPYFSGKGNYLDQVMRCEFQEKMVNDLLVCEDRMTSAHGLEGRVPFLDKSLVEWAFRLPAADKMKGRQTKALWKRVAGEQLPPEIMNKTKQGFSFNPYEQWRKDLRPLVEKELSREWCEASGLFNYGFIQALLQCPAHPRLRWHYFLVWLMVGVKQWMEVFDVQD